MRSPFSCSSKPLPKSSTDRNLFEMSKEMQPCVFLAQISAFPETSRSSVCFGEVLKGCNRPEGDIGIEYIEIIARLYLALIKVGLRRHLRGVASSHPVSR
jgi:hypothetical protein